MEAPTNDDPDAAELVGTMTTPPPTTPPPSGLPAFAGWDQEAAFAAAVSQAQQQVQSAPTPSGKDKGAAEVGFQDPTFQVQVKSQSGRLETNGKTIYISGFAPSAASSSSKVDAWTRMKSMRLPPGDDPLNTPGAQLHLRPDHLDDGWLVGAIAMLYAKPELISRIHTCEASLGVHAVRLFKDGEAKGVAAEWGTVIIDDQLPCHGKKKPIFSTVASCPLAASSSACDQSAASLGLAAVNLNMEPVATSVTMMAYSRGTCWSITPL